MKKIATRLISSHEVQGNQKNDDASPLKLSQYIYEEINTNTIHNQKNTIGLLNHLRVGKICLLLMSVVLILLTFSYIASQSQEQNHQEYFNNENEGNRFGYEKQFIIDFLQSDILLQDIYRSLRQDSLIIERVIKGSQIKMLNIQKFQEYINTKIRYALYYFNFNKSLESNNIKLKEQRLKQYFKVLQKFQFQQKQGNKNISFKLYLASQLLKQESYAYEAEYQYLDYFYNLSSIRQESSICIFTQGASNQQKEYIKFLQSLENVNYTNFHIVYVEQFEKGKNTSQVYHYLKSSNLRVKNRIKIIRNLQQIGTVGNIYIWAKKYCKQNDIVLILNNLGSLIGRQSLNVLNSIYRQPLIWSTNSRLLFKYQEFLESKNETVIYTQHSTNHQYLSSFRKDLLDSIPIYSLLAYAYDKRVGTAWPNFIRTNLQNYGKYFQIERIAQYQTKNLDQYLFTFPQNNISFHCRHIISDYHRTLIEIKNPLMQISKIGEKVKWLQLNFTLDEQIKNDNKTRKILELLRNCTKQANKKQQDKKQSQQQKQAEIKKKQHYKFLQQISNTTKLTQLYNFQRQGTLIYPSTQLKTDKNQTLFEDLNFTLAKGEVTVVMTTSGRYALLSSCLKRFFMYNTYPIKRFIVVQDGPTYQQLQRLIQRYKNITWLITNKPIGQLASIDIAYSMIQTEYYLHMQDDRLPKNSGFIEYSLNIYTIFPDATQIELTYPRDEPVPKDKKWTVQNYRSKLSAYTGYSLAPSLHKLSVYKKAEGGFSGITYFSSFGKGAGIAEFLTGMYFVKRGGYTIMPRIRFLVHVGDSAQNKFWKDQYPNSVAFRKLTKDWADYDKWVNQQTQKQK